jgi:hypothetical protein
MFINFSLIFNLIYVIFTYYKYNISFYKQYIILINNPYAIPFYNYKVLSYFNYLATNNRLLPDNIWDKLFSNKPKLENLKNSEIFKKIKNSSWNLRIISTYIYPLNKYDIFNCYIERLNIIYDVDLNNYNIRYIKDKEYDKNKNISKLIPIKLFDECLEHCKSYHKNINNDYFVTTIEWNIIIYNDNYYFTNGNIIAKCIETYDYYYYEKYTKINNISCNNILDFQNINKLVQKISHFNYIS